jgi:hypothetical protein
MEPTKPASEEPTASSPIDYRKGPTYRNEYANNAFLEPSTWDLKINFGQLDQSIAPNVVIQHTGITLPWNQVKVLSYFLQLHLLSYEQQNGRVTMGKNIIKPVPPPDKATAPNFAKAMGAYKAFKKLYDEFLAANPEAAPDE